MNIFGDNFIDHFLNPRNVGEIENPDSIGIFEDEKSGGKIVFHLKIINGKIEDIKYKILGCPSAISSASLISEKFKGKDLNSSLNIDLNFLKENFGDLPEDILNCGVFAIEAFKNAILNFLKKEE
jgi:nitrogen fixation NifU-like protein